METAPQSLMYITWSLPQLLIVLLIVVLLFGRGKIPDLMSDVAKGIKSFKKGLSDDDTPASPQTSAAAKPLDHDPSRPADAKTTTGTETKA